MERNSYSQNQLKYEMKLLKNKFQVGKFLRNKICSKIRPNFAAIAQQKEWQNFAKMCKEILQKICCLGVEFNVIFRSYIIFRSYKKAWFYKRK